MKRCPCQEDLNARLHTYAINVRKADRPGFSYFCRNPPPDNHINIMLTLRPLSLSDSLTGHGYCQHAKNKLQVKYVICECQHCSCRTAFLMFH